MEEGLEYKQYLSDELKELYFNSKLRGLIQSNKDVIFSVRKDEIHIYYLGGRILKITKSHDKLRCAIDLKYAKKRRGSDEFNEYGDLIKELNDKERYNIDSWIKNFDKLKSCMREYRKVFHNDERQLQQDLELENRDFDDGVIVIDNEYGVREKHNRSSKLYKVDLVTLYRDNGKYKICLVELKCGNGAINGKAGISDHISDFKMFLNKRKPDIIASVNNLIEYKNLNNSLYHVPNDIKIDENTEICVSILCYDLPQIQHKSVANLIEDARKSVDFSLYYNCTLDSNNHKLTKKDILGV